MAALYEVYTTELHKHLGYRGTWLPGTPIELGTVGPIERGVFQPESSLAQLGIPFAVLKDKVPDGSLDFRSEGAVRVTFKAAGKVNDQFQALAAADVGAKIGFSRDSAVLLELRGVVVDRISDKAALKHDLMDALEEVDPARRWQRDWVVVTDVVRAETATVLVSGSGRARLELRASGTVEPASLADAKANFAIADEENVTTLIVAKAGLTPLYRGFRVKRRFWWLYDEVLAADAASPDVEEVFDEADPAEDVGDDNPADDGSDVSARDPDR